MNHTTGSSPLENCEAFGEDYKALQTLFSIKVIVYHPHGKKEKRTSKEKKPKKQ